MLRVGYKVPPGAIAGEDKSNLLRYLKAHAGRLQHRGRIKARAGGGDE